MPCCHRSTTQGICHPAFIRPLGARSNTGLEWARPRTRTLARLRHLYELASRTGKLARFLVFGSFVSATDGPRDVDVVLVMAPDFKLEEAPRECQTLFSHPDAEARFGASMFWIREGMLPEDLMREFLDTWQTKPDGTKRGIVEIKP
ncbi:MAG: DUF6932 family protein [Methyloceanibacter sp.]